MKLLILLCAFFSSYEVSAEALKKDANGASISKEAKFKFEVLQKQSDVVWGFDFLSDSKIIFTEREGALRTFDLKTKKVVDIKGAPKVWASNQGGMLDVRVHPKKKNKIYLTYSEPVGDDDATTAFASAILEGNQLKDFKKHFSADAPNDGGMHFGSRIEFDDKGYVFVTVGDRNVRENVLNLKFDTGKLHRFNEDGSVPKDNPFKEKDAKPSIWSIGHRSPQGLSRHPETGELYLVEMGPRGGDEVNLIKRGANYGWPQVTYGREYWGPSIGSKQKEGTEQPIVYWVPSISPSGSTFYTGKAFENWKNNLFIGCLSGQHLRRLVFENGKVVRQEELLSDLNLRIRNVRTGPDGALYLSTDDGKIARLVVSY